MDRANEGGAVFARREYPQHIEAARQRTATFIGARPAEIAFTRNATESLQTLIGQYRRLRAGDSVMYADLDYASMQLAMNALAQRDGASVVRIDLPEPASRAGIIDIYQRALEANPRVRLLLLTHTNNKTGLVHPVRDVIEIARARNVGRLRRFQPAQVDRRAGGARRTLHPREPTGRHWQCAWRRDPGGSHRRTRTYRHDELRRNDDEPGMACALTSFRLHGRGSRDANVATARALLEEFDIFTVQRTGIARGDCIRVTPALHNLPPDMDHLADALRTLAARG